MSDRNPDPAPTRHKDERGQRASFDPRTGEVHGSGSGAGGGGNPDEDFDSDSAAGGGAKPGESAVPLRDRKDRA